MSRDGGIEVGDEQDRAGRVHRPSPAGRDRLGVGVVHALDQPRPAPLALGLARGPRSPIAARRSGRRRPARASAAATAPGRRAGTSRPVSLVDDRAHAGVVGRDRRQPAGHRLDQDDAERLRRLGGEQEEVGGAQDVGQLGVGDGAEEVDAVARPRPRRRGRGSRRAARRRRRRPGGRVVVEPRQRVDRDVEALEVVGAVERGDEGRDGASGGIPSRSRRPLASGPGENSSASTPFGISISFSGSRSPARRR